MKIKRNKRAEQNLRTRTARIAGGQTGSSLKGLRHSLFGHLNSRSRRPKSFLTLLERDIAAQAERLQQLEQAIVSPLGQLEPVVVAADEPFDQPAEAAAVEEPAMPQANGRTNYQYLPRSQRVRRRIIS